MKKRIKIQGILIFLSILAAISLSKLIFPHWKQEPLDEVLDIFGIGLVLFGFLFRIAARGYKKEKSFDGKALVKDGPYALVRNPMYFGTFMIGIGIILILFKLWIFLLFLVIFLFIYIPQINKEEAILLKRFGQEYNNYCKITPKYFPSVYHLLNIRRYVSLKLVWIKKELFSLLIVLSVTIVIEVWQDVRLFGYKEFLEELFELFVIIVSFMIISIFFREKNC